MAINDHAGRRDALARIHPTRHLDDAQARQFAAGVDAIRAGIMKDLGARDATYIRRLIRIQRTLEIGGRAIIYLGILYPLLFAVGALVLATAKILENMEIGHNVLHGQWDWLRDPKIQSKTWEWDNVCPSAQWQRSHNVLHHKWTNVIGKDRDYGYHVLRLSEKQPWKPVHLMQPVSNLLMALLFQWGVAVHDDELGSVRTGERTAAEVRPKLHRLLRKMARQVGKDYLLFPLLAGPHFLAVLLANVAANLIRNVWAYAVIFCGHFPDGVEAFTENDVANEDRARWYLRQLLGSANIEGSRLMHIMSGNLSHQIEHHLFPKMPSNRYAEAAVAVRALCAELGLPYNSRPLLRQLFSVQRKVFRYALPGASDAMSMTKRYFTSPFSRRS